MNLSDVFPTDTKKIEDGVWFKFGKKAKFLMTYFNSSKAQLNFNTSLRKMKLENDLLPKAEQLTPEDLTLKCTIETLVNMVVLDFKGVSETDDQTSVETIIVYSKERLKKMLLDYDGLALQLMERSLKIDEFRRGETKSTIKK